MPQHAPISDNPIQDMRFRGLHWIEASAGSGKTFTLSSLMVRLLISDFLPKQVVATTFTRAAAAELKSRIRDRLQQTYAFLKQQREQRPEKNIALAAQQSDPLYAQLLQQYASRMGYACERLQLVITQLDELFVGTLDSFCQKLLREFAFESANVEQLQISDEPRQHSLQLIHDALRAWIAAQPQILIDWMYRTGNLHAAEAYLSLVESSLNFPRAHWQSVSFDCAVIDQHISQMSQIQWPDVSNIWQDTGLEAYQSHLNRTSFKAEQWLPFLSQVLPSFAQLWQSQQPLPTIWQFYQAHKKDLQSLHDKITQQKIFKKSLAEPLQQQVYQHAIFATLAQVLQQFAAFESLMQQANTALQTYLCEQVKLSLPQQLLQAGETTFAMQMQTLSNALSSSSGQAFASAVHQRYPMILVDEFQDTNSDQDLMLAHIWRAPTCYQNGCMIMVGDRKQAIYGFRGGDMLTFIAAHADVRAKDGRFYVLKYNHRSVQALVEQVDQLFQRAVDFGEDVIYMPVFAGSRPHPHLIDAEQSNPAPLRWIAFDSMPEQAEKTAWQIAELLQQAARGELYFQLQDGSTQPLCPDDIAVLSAKNIHLDQVQAELKKLRIPIKRNSRQSVFEGLLAQDVAAVLLAIQQPFNEARIKRALLSSLLGYNSSAVDASQAHAAQLISDSMLQFDRVQKTWREQGFMPAWQQLLSRFAVWEKLANAPKLPAERALVNLRHLTELLQKHSQQFFGIQRLSQWFLVQIQQPLQREWEIERPLSQAHGVQLMTIHQSKGLEFKVVFLLSSNVTPNNESKSELNFSSSALHQAQSVVNTPDAIPQKHQNQRIIQLKSDPNLSELDKQANTARNTAELNRLWYVALTRASHRVYALCKNEKTASRHGSYFWVNAPDQPPMNQQFCATLLQQPAVYHEPALPHEQLHAVPLPEQQWYVRGRTSFTGLTKQAHARTGYDAVAVVYALPSASADEVSFDSALDPFNSAATVTTTVTTTAATTAATATTAVQTQPPEQPSSVLAASSLTDQAPSSSEPILVARSVVEAQPLPDIQSHFPKGAMAGNFLHELLEHIDFSDNSLWAEQLKRRLDNHYPLLKPPLLQHYASKAGLALDTADTAQHALLQQQIDQDMQAWLSRILATPIHTGFALQQLSPQHRVAEFAFDLSLAARRLNVQALREMLNQHLQQQFAVQLPQFTEAPSARYLTGSIDLLYQFEGRFYIADYKSNFLGHRIEHYAQTALQRSMAEASYWLQALIYLVALHRYLKVHWPQYDIQQHLGGASYLYLRGMQGQADYGVQHWPAPVELVLSVDALLGQSQTQNQA